MKKIFIFLLLTGAMKTYAQTYDDSSAYEAPEIYAQEDEDAPYLEPIEYPEEYISDDRDYSSDSDNYEEL